ncbi:MAG: HisA/HisF-related TIM barrel protein, partial [Planctomycetota bacterium]|nr:HisA/HisF-related TIM barrel protein [Planctomycetota bacterium]
DQKWEIYTHGGRKPTGIDALEWGDKVQEQGAGEILLTSMDCDGTKAGYDIELTREMSRRLEIPIIASGGAGSLEHISDVLADGEADAALAASIFHFREISIGEVKQHLEQRGIAVRI